MPGIVEFPKVVRDAVDEFGDLFASEPQRRHFAEYLTGLMVAERKTVLGIHDEFAHIRDQSCLNRFLTEVEWDVDALNERRIELLQKESETRFTDRGVIPIDNVLIDHDGKFIEDVGWFWDHAEERYKIAHDYLIVNYVCTSGSTIPWSSAVSRSRTSVRLGTYPSKTTRTCSRSWSIGFTSTASPGPSPWTATSPTPRFSTTSTEKTLGTAAPGAMSAR
jgi:hypothetical protein